MNYDYRVFLFRGTRTEEKLQIDKEIVSLSAGQIVCTIMELDTDFFRREQLFVKRIREIEEDYLSERKGSSFTEDAVAREHLQQIKAVLFEAQPTEFGEALLHRLMIYLPCFYAYERAYIPTMRSLPNSTYLRKVSKYFGRPDGGGDNDVLAYQQMEHEVMKYADAYAGWNSFFVLLEDDRAELYWRIVAKEFFGVGRDYSYTSLLEGCLSELRRLQIDLQMLYDHNDSESLQLLGEAIPGPRVYQGSASLIGSDDEGSSRYSQVYEITTFSDLVRAERMLLSAIDREVRQCKVCGKFFVPYRTEADACQRSNPGFGGKTCSRVYSQMKYHAAHPDLSSPMGTLYMKRYKAYSKWANESISFLLNHAKLIYGREELGKETSEITKEISERQELWRESAKGFLYQIGVGEISAEQFEAQTKLPKIIDRSPRFAAFRKEISLSLGALSNVDKF